MTLHRLAFALSIAAVSAACTVNTTDSNTGVGTGQLEVYWTIASTKDVNECTAAGASFARVDVLDSTGAKVNSGADTQSCTTFGTSFTGSFASGTHTVQATLVGADGVTAVTTTVSTLVNIPSDGTIAQLSVDFPTSSFIAPTTGTGKLEVYWTLDGVSDPNECTTRSVATAQVDVYDASGAKLDTGGDMQACSTLGTSFTTTFAPGSYTVRATMLGSDGSARTTTATSPVTITNGTTGKVTIDFPSTSFF